MNFDSYSVRNGQTFIVARMKTSEIETIQSQVEDAVEIARNQLDKVNRGVEPEVLASAKNLQQTGFWLQLMQMCPHEW